MPWLKPGILVFGVFYSRIAGYVKMVTDCIPIIRSQIVFISHRQSYSVPLSLPLYKLVINLIHLPLKVAIGIVQLTVAWNESGKLPVGLGWLRDMYTFIFSNFGLKSGPSGPKTSRLNTMPYVPLWRTGLLIVGTFTVSLCVCVCVQSIMSSPTKKQKTAAASAH